MRHLLVGSFVLAGLVSSLAGSAQAQLVETFSSVQRGDFLIIGNTLGQDCGVGVAAPVVGTMGDCGPYTADSSLDVFWRSDSPQEGQAEANTSVTDATARSSSVLTLPEGATITQAWLIWGGDNSTTDGEVLFERPGVFAQSLTSEGCFADPSSGFGCYVDVTSIITSNNNGVYRFSGLSIPDVQSIDHSNAFAAWSLIVAYQLDSLPVRSLHLYLGYGAVKSGAPQTLTVPGMIVPLSAWGQLGIVAYEGDNTATGDSVSVNESYLVDASNPQNNLFNGTRCYLGSPVSVPGDLPQLTGGPGSVTGIDMDVFDIASRLLPGSTGLSVSASTTAVNSDQYALGALTVAVDTLYPQVSATETVENLTYGGAGVRLGDTLRYTVTVNSSGTSDAQGIRFLAKLPAEVALVSGSLVLVSDPGSGTKTDEPDDDQAEYDVPAGAVVFRLGEGANSESGGLLPPGSVMEFSYDVLVISDSPEYIESQGFVTYDSLEPGQVVTTATDGDTEQAGTQPTAIEVSHSETCNGKDDDLDGVVDNGFDVGAACAAGVGACSSSGHRVCLPDGAAACDAIPGEPKDVEFCGDNSDDDCDGSLTNGCQCTELGETRECGTLTPEQIASGGACKQGVETCIADDTVGLAWGQCDGLVLPADETCGNEIDDNCDGEVDESCPVDSDEEDISGNTDIQSQDVYLEDASGDTDPRAEDTPTDQTNTDTEMADLGRPDAQEEKPANSGGCGMVPRGHSPAPLVVLLVALALALRRRGHWCARR